jgi:hypothetical protein
LASIHWQTSAALSETPKYSHHHGKGASDVVQILRGDAKDLDVERGDRLYGLGSVRSMDYDVGGDFCQRFQINDASADTAGFGEPLDVVPSRTLILH